MSNALLKKMHKTKNTKCTHFWYDSNKDPFFFIPADAYSSSMLKELEMLNFLDSGKHIICLGTSPITYKMEALYRLKHPMC